MGAYVNNAIIPLVQDVASTTLSQEELDAIHAGKHLRIYEPVVIPNEIIFSSTGDILMAWGGEYVT